jgi:membrane protease YdiL (CAAX protease family)
VRAFTWFLGAILMAGVAAALLAYPAYEFTSRFAAFAFHRVAGRIAMLVLLVELTWLCRHLHLVTKQDFGYGLPWRRFIRVSLGWGLIGAATAAVGAVFLLATHLRAPDPNFTPSPLNWLRVFGVGLGGGISVALIEETVMRGAMHTAIEREANAWTAALLTAPLYAVLHFYAKASIPPPQIAWGSGFELLARSFAPLLQPPLVFDAFLSWLAVGLILSLTRVLTGNIAVALGLHAGWVLVLRMLQETTVSGSAPTYAPWVGRFDGLLGLWMLPWSAVIATALWLTRGWWTPAARTPAP